MMLAAIQQLLSPSGIVLVTDSYLAQDCTLPSVAHSQWVVDMGVQRSGYLYPTGDNSEGPVSLQNSVGLAESITGPAS
jgi:hypothetical protein